MGRYAVIAVGSVLVLVGALDLASRWVLGRDLVDLARAAPAAPVPAAAPAPAIADVPLVTTLDFGRYTILAVAAAGCVREPACLVTLTIEPARGFLLSPEAPYAFLPTPNAAVTYDAPPGKIRARERTPVRAVVAVPSRRSVDAPRLLEGKVRVVTCDADACKSEVQAITVAMPERLPSG